MWRVLSKSFVAVIFSGAALVCGGSELLADLWINEFHYDNVGDDGGEFIEVVIAPNMAALDLSTAELTLYNGANGASYNTRLLSTFASVNTIDGYSFYTYLYPPDGIQNGAPDGIALSVNNVLVPGQFLSYEGIVTAADGDANGLMSTNIGVSESGTTPVGHSLQLTGLNGSQYSDFTWASASAATPNLPNNGQSFAAIPEPPAGLFGGLVCGVVGLVVGGRRWLGQLRYLLPQ
jgi:hypothetical protein